MNGRSAENAFENKLYLDGGFTYDPHFGFIDGTYGRFIVSIRDNLILSTDISRRQLKDMINEASRENLLIGAWKDTETNLRHWDYVATYNKLERARQVAVDNNQIAIYDSLTKEEIRI